MKLFRKIAKIELIIKEMKNVGQDNSIQTSAPSPKHTPKENNKAKKTKKVIDNHTEPTISIPTTLRQVWHLLTGMRKKLPFMFIAMFINSLVGIFSISLIIPFVLLLQNTSYIASSTDISQLDTYKQIIINLSRYIYTTFELSNTNTLIIIYGVAFIAVFIIKHIIGVYIECKMAVYSTQATRHFSSKIFSVFLYISYTYYLGKNITKSLYTIGLSEKNYGLIIGLFNLINDLVFIVFLSVGVALWTPEIIVVGIGIFLIVTIVYFFSHLALKRLGSLTVAINEQSNKSIYQGIHNFVFSRLFNAESFFTRWFNTIAGYNITISPYRQLLLALPRITIEILMVLAFIGYAVFIVLLSPMNIEDIITTAALLGGVAIRFMPIALRITGYLGTFAGDQKAVDLFYKEYIAAQKNSVVTDTQNILPLAFNKSIEVKNLSFVYPTFNNDTTEFHYEESRPILRDISMTINKGEKIGIVGSSGGGKTTLMHILMAFLEPSQGSILIDGINVSTHMRNWHQNIGYVPQETMLMHGSVLSNIAFGIDPREVEEEQVVRVLTLANMWDSIKQLPQGIHSNIGDSGKLLSGGQRQRLGIARALYRNPSIIFFDEATSNLDNKTEKEVQTAIDSLDNHITIIMIAHRLNTLKNCDTIYNIHDGTITFTGNYEQMMEYHK